MACEIIECKEYECEVDIWSIGVITFILLTGDAPFKGSNQTQIRRQIREKDLNFEGPQWKTKSEESKDFILRALDRNQKTRWTAQQLLEHPWIENRKKLKSKPLTPE